MRVIEEETGTNIQVDKRMLECVVSGAENERAAVIKCKQIMQEGFGGAVLRVNLHRLRGCHHRAGRQARALHRRPKPCARGHREDRLRRERCVIKGAPDAVAAAEAAVLQIIDARATGSPATAAPAAAGTTAATTTAAAATARTTTMTARPKDAGTGTTGGPEGAGTTTGTEAGAEAAGEEAAGGGGGRGAAEDGARPVTTGTPHPERVQYYDERASSGAAGAEARRGTRRVRV